MDLDDDELLATQISRRYIKKDIVKRDYISKDKLKEIIGWNLVIKDEKSNNYRPIKNTTAQDVYEAFYKIRELVKERIHE